jgi:hypothetical protein
MTVNIAALNIAPNRRYIIFFAYIYRWNLFYSIIVTNAAILVCSGSFWNYRQRKRKIQVPEGEPNTPGIPTCRMGTWGAYLYKIFEHEEHVSVTL